MNRDFIIINARVVTPEGVIEQGTVTVRNGIITAIGAEISADLPVFDAEGKILLPGFIDMHSDAIEKEIEPRPGSLLPLDIAIAELDKKLAGAGITTMYHSLTFADKEFEILRTMDMVDTIIHAIDRLKPNLLVRTKVHGRYEITCSKAFPVLETLIHQGVIDMVSIMDHTPGQGQFTTEQQFRDYYGPRFSNDDATIRTVMEKRQEIRETVGLDNAEKMATLCREKSIPLASHDDDHPEKIDFIDRCGAVISEFPITELAAREAKALGLAIAVGSPNIVRGGSHNGNLRAEDLIRENLATIVCSDYIPSTMLHAAFSLLEKGICSLTDIAALFSSNAADALSIDDQTGRIATGLCADLILIDTALHFPRVVATWVEGRKVYESCPA